MPTGRLREIWGRDDVAWNAWLTLEGPTSAGLIAAAGFDAVTLDIQHGAVPPDDMAVVLAAIEAEGVPPFARLRWNDPAEIMRALDVGARGLICPMIGTRGEAEALVAASRYPPDGVRSYGPVSGALGAGLEHVRRSNGAVLVFAMIETAEGLANVDAIASTPGVDGLYVGPADLSLGLGLATFADLNDPALLAALEAVVAAARRHGIVPGIHAPLSDRAAEMAQRGFRLVSALVDADLVRSGAVAALEATRARLAR